MIYINKDSENIQVMRFQSYLSVPYYLFEFTNKVNKNTVYFSAADQSGGPCFYHWFNIIETGTTYQNLTAGTVNLFPSGEWLYNVYEASALTLSVSATTGRVLETGNVVVNGYDNAIPSIYQ